MKKFLVAISIAAALGVLVFLIFVGRNYFAVVCNITGGKYFYHAFGNSCENVASDAGKTCTYNNECSKGCLYTNPAPKDIFDLNDGKFQLQDTGVTGRCDPYFGDADGALECHRTELQNLQCDFIIS